MHNNVREQKRQWKTMILVEIGFLGVKADIVGNAAWLETFTVSVIIPLMLEIVTVSVISPLSFFAATAVAKDIIASPKLNPKPLSHRSL